MHVWRFFPDNKPGDTARLAENYGRQLNMSVKHNWRVIILVLGGVIATLAFYLLLSSGLWNTWFDTDRQGAPRPSTINNVVLSIESNIMRIQTIMETLVFKEYPKEIADDVNAINQLESSILIDLKRMGGHFHVDNIEYHRVSVLFREWKNIRDKAIKLTTTGLPGRAKMVARVESAAQARKIREALMSLKMFSDKQIGDFDSASSAADREKRANK